VRYGLNVYIQCRLMSVLQRLTKYRKVKHVAVLLVTVTKISTVTSVGQSVTVAVFVLVVTCKSRNSVI